MCGIVGYVGSEQAAPVLLKGLATLEYRGYDSAGIAVWHGGQLEMAKAAGKLQVLRDLTAEGSSLPGTMGIGHTRWATHGEPTDVNAHPHLSRSGRFAVVHNGIIENYQQLKTRLQRHGYNFVSQTDTEVIAQLVEYYYKGDMLDTMIQLMNQLEGSYSLGILCVDEPERFYAVRKDSPLVVGLGQNENLIASDVAALLAYTQDVYYLEMNFDALVKSTRKHKIAAEELSKFPEVKRDLALLIDKQVTFSALRDVAFATERKLLKSVSLFDVYEGDKLPEGKKSYALSFILEDKTRTLDEKTIEKAMRNLTAQFEQRCGAQVRG